jgi:uncharacterized lipoprotein NlpE involved in copper resistance
MQANSLKPGLIYFFLSLLIIVFVDARAESDKQLQEKVLRAREMNQQHAEHAGHENSAASNSQFRGVFYGYLPCDDCDGIKMTLSLKQNNNYLLVIQPARESNREYFEKGKYDWNEQNGTLLLTSRKESKIRRYRIEDAGALVQLNPDGSRVSGDQERYTLRRSDAVKSREVHIH